jgi:hypothetical protein
MENKIRGLHHVTAIAGDPQRSISTTRDRTIFISAIDAAPPEQS